MVNNVAVKIGEEWYDNIADYFIQNREGEFRD